MDRSRGTGWLRFAAKALYWLLVIAVSVGLLIGLVMFFESRDESGVGEDARTHQITRR